MHENFHPDLAPEDRLKQLQIEADRTLEGQHYQRELTEEEILDRREKFTQNSINLGNLDDELDLIKEGFKLKMKPLKEENTVLLQQLKTKQESKRDNLYEIFDHANSMAVTYNTSGEWVSERRLRPDEKQTSLYAINKTSAK